MACGNYYQHFFVYLINKCTAKKLDPNKIPFSFSMVFTLIQSRNIHMISHFSWDDQLFNRISGVFRFSTNFGRKFHPKIMINEHRRVMYYDQRRSEGNVIFSSKLPLVKTDSCHWDFVQYFGWMIEYLLFKLLYTSTRIIPNVILE